MKLKAGAYEHALRQISDNSLGPQCTEYLGGIICSGCTSQVIEETSLTSRTTPYYTHDAKRHSWSILRYFMTNGYESIHLFRIGSRMVY